MGVANVYNNLGYISATKGDYLQSLDYYKKTFGIFLSVYDDNHPSVAILYSNIGDTYKKQRDYSHALEYYFKELRIIEKRDDPKSLLNTAYSCLQIGIIYKEERKKELALEYLRKSLKIREEVLGKEDAKTLEVLEVINSL